jgi:hypothetical protein
MPVCMYAVSETEFPLLTLLLLLSRVRNRRLQQLVTAEALGAYSSPPPLAMAPLYGFMAGSPTCFARWPLAAAE